MLYKFHAKNLIKKGISLDRDIITQISLKVAEVLAAKGSCQVVVTGGPGCGKSTLARVIKEKGFLNIPKKQLVVIDDLRGHTLACASTLDAEVSNGAGSKVKTDEAGLVGALLAKRALSQGITQVIFDRGGYQYHGYAPLWVSIKDVDRQAQEY